MILRTLFNFGKKRRIDLSRDLLKSILTLGAVIEARDAYTGGHTWRVAQYSRMLAEQIGLSASDIFLAELGGFIHDIGKVGIPDQVLNKTGSLTEDEYSLLKTHPEVGRKLLQEHPLGPLVLDAVTHHHERCDGQGYPSAIDSATLSIYPRIIAVADCFDAMTSTRPYRKGLPSDVALGIMSELRDIQSDGFLVDALANLVATNRLDDTLGHSDAGRRLAVCPMDGPIMAVPHNKSDGDLMYCHACKGIYRLHVAADAFELEPTGQRRFDLQPEIDVKPINTLAAFAPNHVTLIGN
jgi:HD-GYP domain-containing protein (c-di-GMP phosphodiesterase class II)